MNKILLTLRKQILENGAYKLTTYNRMIAYDKKHPAWKVLATHDEIRAFLALRDSHNQNFKAAA